MMTIGLPKSVRAERDSVRRSAWLGEQGAALAHAESERSWAEFYDFEDEVKRWDAEIARLKASIDERRRSPSDSSSATSGGSR